MIITILHHLIGIFKEDYVGKLPPKLHINVGKFLVLPEKFKV